MSDDSIWIRTEPTIDGTAYVVTLSLGEDHALTLTPTRATAYAIALLAAVADAEYDYAVLRQMREKLSVPDDVTAGLVNDMRADRAPREAAGLVFTGGVAHRNRMPFISIHKDGEPIGQMNPARGRRHALHVLEAVPVADLDATYYRTLHRTVGVPEHVARAAVGDLSDYRLDPFADTDT